MAAVAKCDMTKGKKPFKKGPQGAGVPESVTGSNGASRNPAPKEQGAGAGDEDADATKSMDDEDMVCDEVQDDGQKSLDVSGDDLEKSLKLLKNFAQSNSPEL